MTANSTTGEESSTSDEDRMPDESSTSGEGRTPETAVAQGYATLLALLESHGPLESEVIAARAELAVAVARAGRYDEALYQADELAKDCRREHGTEEMREGAPAPDDAHPDILVAERARAQVREMAGIVYA